MAATTYLQELISQGQANGLKSAYVGLWVGDPTVAGLLAGEVSGGGYGRILVPWDPGSTLLVTNAAISWAQASADWGFITHVVLCDSVSGQNVLAYEQLTQVVEVRSGATASIGAGSFSLVIA